MIRILIKSFFEEYEVTLWDELAVQIRGYSVFPLYNFTDDPLYHLYTMNEF